MQGGGTDTGTTLPVAGWYPEPGSPGLQRWWDGRAWTATTRPVSPAPRHVAPIERTVGRWTGSGVSIARRYYLRAELARMLVRVLAVVVFFVLFARIVTTDDSTGVGGAVVAVMVVFALQSLVFEAIKVLRIHRVVAGLPTDGSVGPGEVESRLYAATWRLSQVHGSVSTAMLVVAGLWLYLVARSRGMLDRADVGAATQAGVVFGLALLLGVIIDVREWRTRSSVAAGRLTPANTARPAAATAPAVPSAAAALPLPPAAAAAGGEAILCWAAPLMRVWLRGTRMTRGGWSFAGSMYHDDIPQNTIVVTDSALYLLAVIPPSLAAVLGDAGLYDQVKTGLFYSGTEIRDAGAQLLARGMAAALSSDPRNVRIGRDDVVTVQGSPGRADVVLVLRDGSRQGYVFNHVDAAAAFLAQAGATWLPVSWSTTPPTSLFPPGTLPAVAGAALRVAGALVALIGLVLVLLFGTALVSGVWRAGLSGSATGTVTAVARHPIGKPVAGAPASIDCAVTARFTAEGADHVVADPPSGFASHCGWAVGDQVPVSYRPGDPEQAMLGTPSGADVVGSTAVVLVGLALLVLGLVLAIRPRLILDRVGRAG